MQKEKTACFLNGHRNRTSQRLFKANSHQAFCKWQSDGESTRSCRSSRAKLRGAETASTKTGDNFNFNHTDHFSHRRPPDQGKPHRRKNNFWDKCYFQLSTGQSQFSTNDSQFGFKGPDTISPLSFTIPATLTSRAGQTIPLVLHLHLNRLEHFELSNGRVTLAAAVPRHGEQAAAQQWQDGQEDLVLDSDSPLWIRFHSSVSDADAGSANPSDNHFFEIHLPSMLLKDKPKTITVSGIDFYRSTL